MLDKGMKWIKDKSSSIIAGVADNNCTREGHILHEKEHNTTWHTGNP